MAVRFGLCWLGPNPLSSSSNCGKTQFVCCSPWLLVSDAGSCTPSLFLQPPGPMCTCGQQHPHRHPESHEDRQHRTAWWVGVSRSMRRRYRATVRCMGTAHCCRARLVPVSRRSSRTPSGPRTMATSTHGGRQVCGLGAKVGITAACSVTGWRLPPCNPGPRASSIPPVADMPHVQPDHQLSEGFRALAGGHVGRQGRGAEEPCLALPALDPKPDEGHQVAATGTVAVPQRGQMAGEPGRIWD